ASRRLALPADQLAVEAGVVSAKSDRAKRVAYGELVGGRRLNVVVDGNAKRKPAREWKVLGAAVPRLDLREMATGRFEFVHNVKVPGMLHGAVVRPPSVGATLTSLGQRAAWLRQGRHEKEFRRRRFSETVAGHPGGRQAEGDLDRGRRASC